MNFPMMNGCLALATAAILLSALPADAQESTTMPAPSPATAGGRTITISFWNIAWFPGGKPNASDDDKQKQTVAVHAELARLNPDILGMSEVADWDAAQLAVKKLEGFKVDVCSAFPPGEGRTDTQQVATASRLPPLSAWYERWKKSPAKPPRGFAFAAYQTSPGKVLLVYSLHYKSNRGDLIPNIKAREESTKQLLAHNAEMEKVFAKFGTVATVLMGDFNSSLDDPLFNKERTLRDLGRAGFKWSWEGMNQRERVTLPPKGKFFATTFDHLFIKGAPFQRAWVQETPRVASDHRPVSVLIKR